jgi:ubiquinone/menaquinone biosynthesis C-methylase UbiE
MDEDLVAYYAQGREAERLTDVNPLERLRTELLLERRLPAPPAVVLDVGGGAGAYAIPLAARGYEVHLLDPIELHVAQARMAAEQAGVRLAGALTGDARDLPFAAGAADAVLLLGPLYHLPEAADRVRALEEARRVLRPGGIVAAAAISRFASTIDGLLSGALDDPAFEANVVRALGDGRHRNPERRPGWFTTAYFHLPDELAGEVRAAGLVLDALLAVEGPGAFLPDVAERLADPARRDALLRAIERVEAAPSLLGASPHVLALATAP